MRRPATRVLQAFLVVLILTPAASGCSSDPSTTSDPSAPSGAVTPISGNVHNTSVSAPRTSATAIQHPADSPTPATVTLSRMDLTARVGQLFMAGTSSTRTDSATLDAIASYHVGGIILNGNSTASVDDTLTVTNALQNAFSAQHPAGSPRLLISTDQEGGQVQRLRGPGFDRIPTALEQGKMAPNALKAAAQRWGASLKSAGVNMNLCPVLDTVPSEAFAAENPPIGAFDRQFGYDPGTVQNHGIAVVQGYTLAGVVTSVKHFPGLGRVTGNTDATSGVTDTTTTATDPYLTPFRGAIAEHVPAVMMATAIYSKLDSTQPAAFSRAIVTDLLRVSLGFSGVVISDDLGSAEQVAATPVAERAVRFIAAGGDIVLTVDPTNVAPMSAAVIQRAQKDPAFKAQVDAAVLRVLTLKQRFNLL